MPGLTALHSSFGNDPKKWSRALHESRLIPNRSGNMDVIIKLPNGAISRVSTKQLEKVAGQFEHQGSSEVGEALSALKKRARRVSGSENEPVPLKLFGRTKGRREVLPAAPRIQSTSKSRESAELELSLEEMHLDPEEALRGLFEEVFPDDTIQDLMELENYSLKDQIESITKGATRIEQLKKAVPIFEELIQSRKIPLGSRTKTKQALETLKSKANSDSGWLTGT